MTSRPYLGLARVTVAVVAVAVLTTEPLPAAFVLEGRLLDGAASTAKFRGGQQGKDSWHVPLAGAEVELTLLPGGGSWKARSDPAGKFRVDTGLGAIPPDARVVAVARTGDKTLYSPSFDPRGDDLGVFVYETTDDPDDVLAELVLVHDVVERAGRRLLRVRCNLVLFSRGRGLYVGRREGSPSREVFRLPLPRGARVENNSGPAPGLLWKPSTNGRWLVIDEPVPGLPDAARQISSGGRLKPWSVEYVAPASQEMAFEYFVPVVAQAVSVYVVHDDMNVVSGQLQLVAREVTPDPRSREAGHFDRFDAVAPGGGRLGPRAKVLMGLVISNAAVGQISNRSIRWHGGFVLISLVAILMGLVLGPRRPPPEAELAGLGRDEVIDRLAALDRRRERGKIGKKEYALYREALLAVAADEFAADETPPAGGGAPAPTASAATVFGAAASSPEVRKLLERLGELEGSTDPSAIQERAHLLEALYQVLKGDRGE